MFKRRCIHYCELAWPIFVSSMAYFFIAYLPRRGVEKPYKSVVKNYFLNEFTIKYWFNARSPTGDLLICYRAVQKPSFLSKLHVGRPKDNWTSDDDTWTSSPDIKKYINI